MKPRFLDDLKGILKQIYNNKNNFYFKKYNRAKISQQDISHLSVESFKLFPVTRISEFANSNYKERCLNEKPGINKLIFSPIDKKYILFHRNLSEIKKEGIPIYGKRPMVIIQDVYDSIETCLYFYEHKILPLIGEISNPSVIYSTASQYRVDALYVDQSSYRQFAKELLKLNLPIKAIVISDSITSLPPKLSKNISLDYVFSISEIGPIATLCPESGGKTLKFHTLDDIYIEEGRQALITSLRLTSCPIIRYEIGFTIKKSNSKCSCRREALAILEN